MNKYTLTFVDSQIEKQFIQYSADNYRVKAFNFCTICYIVYFIFSITLYVKDFDKQKVIARAISIFILILSLIIVRKWNYRADLGLGVLNLVLSAFEWEKDDSYDNYNYYLYGNNSMLIHTLLLFTQSLKPAVLTNFILCAIRITITAYYTEIIYVQLMLAIISTFGLVYILYLQEKFSRQSFLMALKDDSWETMLPSILKKPFIMFNFDEENLNYQLKVLNRQNFPFQEENTLQHFLGSAYVNKQSLKEYIYNWIVKNKIECKFSYINELQIVYLGKKIEVLLFEYHLEQSTYFLILQSEGNEKQDYQCKFKKLHDKYLLFFQNHIRQTERMLKKCVIQKSQNLIIHIMISHRESLAFQKHLLAKPKLVSINKMLIGMIKYFNRLRYTINLIIEDDIKIQTIYPYLIGFLFEIFKIMERFKDYSIEICIVRSKIHLIIQGLNEIPQTKLFYQCEQFLISDKYHSEKGYEFVFLEEPNIPFKNGSPSEYHNLL